MIDSSTKSRTAELVKLKENFGYIFKLNTLQKIFDKELFDRCEDLNKHLPCPLKIHRIGISFLKSLTELS